MNEELKIIIKAQTDNLKKNVQDAQQKVKSFQEQVKEASKEVDSKFKAAGASIANGMKIGAAGIAAAGVALLSLSTATAEYRNEQAKLVTAFQSAGGTAAQAKETYNDLYRVLGDTGQATEAANHLAKLTTNEKELSEWTTITTGVYATFGASLPIESLTEAANETAKTGALTGALADSLNWAGVNEEKFQEKLDACNTEAEREQLIRSTLNGLYSDAASKYEENNSAVLAQNEAQAKLDATMASLGETVAPVITILTDLANTALSAIQPYVKDFAETYLPEIKDVLKEVTEKLGEAFDWITEHKAVLAVMAGIIAGITAAITLYNIVAAVKTAMDAAQVTTLGALIVAQLASAAATIVALAPYLLIVAAIAAVIAIIVLCVKHWDTIKETIVKVANKVKEKVIEMKDKVVTSITNMKNSFVNKINELKNKAQDTFNTIKSKITKPVETAKNKIKEMVDKIKGFFDFDWKFPKLKMPHFKATGEFSLNPPSVPKISVDWYARGGVFDKPTLFPYGGSIGGLGEAGAEAIVPLENNTEWLDKIAAKLQGNSQPVILQIDGKTFGEITVETINNLTKQRGSLPLVLG